MKVQTNLHAGKNFEPSTLRNWEVVISISHVVTDSNFIVDLALQYC